MVSIFIRTYHKDIKWLNYCLRSIHQNLTGWDEIVVCIPKGQEHLLSHLTSEKVVTCKKYSDDYLGQQISKLQAHNYCSHGIIMFIDSDVVFFEKTTVQDYMHNEKPVLLKDKYENVGDAIIWKKITEKLYKHEIAYESMRRAPQLFLKSTLEEFNKYFRDIEFYITSQSHRAFSEFNALGHFVELWEEEKYHIMDLSIEQAPRNKAVQHWSWSGLTEEERIEIERRLNENN